jgi:hypothetical protein
LADNSVFSGPLMLACLPGGVNPARFRQPVPRGGGLVAPLLKTAD